MKLHRMVGLLGFLLLVFFIEWGGHEMTFTSVKDWYLTLHKASWNPPSWVFGPVWTLLYISIAVSGWQIWSKIKPCSMRRRSFFFYGAQLAANFSWSFFFFFLKSPLLGLLDLSLLIVLLAINIFYFIKLYRPAGLLLIPYFLWSLYAFFLNFAIWRLN